MFELIQFKHFPVGVSSLYMATSAREKVLSSILAGYNIFVLVLYTEKRVIKKSMRNGLLNIWKSWTIPPFGTFSRDITFSISPKKLDVPPKTGQLASMVLADLWFLLPLTGGVNSQYVALIATDWFLSITSRLD